MSQSTHAGAQPSPGTHSTALTAQPAARQQPGFSGFTAPGPGFCESQPAPGATPAGRPGPHSTLSGVYVSGPCRAQWQFQDSARVSGFWRRHEYTPRQGGVWGDSSWDGYLYTSRTVSTLKFFHTHFLVPTVCCNQTSASVPRLRTGEPSV